jgi:uncharacterized protein (TIGR02611 family)
MEKVYRATRKVFLGLVGSLVLLLGLIMIPVPGPGLLICLLGLFILSLEFEWAKPHMDRIKAKFAKIVAEAKAKVDDKS